MTKIGKTHRSLILIKSQRNLPKLTLKGGFFSYMDLSQILGRIQYMIVIQTTISILCLYPIIGHLNKFQM